MNVILIYLLILVAITISVYIYLMISKGELDVGDSNNNKLFVTYDPNSNNITTEPVSNVTNLISSNAGNILKNSNDVATLNTTIPTTYQKKADMKNYYNMTDTDNRYVQKAHPYKIRTLTSGPQSNN